MENFLYKFDNLKPKTRNEERYYEYLTLILNQFIALYDTDIMDCLDIDSFYTMLVNHTRLGCVKGLDGKPHIGELRFESGLNESGKMSPCGIMCGNGNTYTVGDNCTGIEVIKYLYTDDPIRIFSRFANQLAEVDLSQKVLVKATRSGQIRPVGSETEKKRLEKAYSDVSDGELATYVLDFNLNGTDSVEKAIDVFDTTKISSMEYLSSYHSELCRRLYGLFGFSMQGKDKQAQVTTDELDDRELPSIIVPMLILNNLSDSFNKINNSFGFNFSIKPSKILQKQLKDALTDSDEMKEGEQNETEKPTE